MKLLITGSRDTTDGMLEAIGRILTWVAANNHSIVIGDAKGVDSWVIDGCLDRNIPFVCCGIANQPRYWRAKGQNYRRVETDVSAIENVKDVWKASYLGRDRAMVHLCDRCVAIWNGKSTGTIYTYMYAFKLGKAEKTDLRIFADGMPVVSGADRPELYDVR